MGFIYPSTRLLIYQLIFRPPARHSSSDSGFHSAACSSFDRLPFQALWIQGRFRARDFLPAFSYLRYALPGSLVVSYRIGWQLEHIMSPLQGGSGETSCLMTPDVCGANVTSNRFCWIMANYGTNKFSATFLSLVGSNCVYNALIFI